MTIAGVTAKEFHDDAIYGISEYQFYGSGKTYVNIAEGTLNAEGNEITTIATSEGKQVSISYYDAFDKEGNLKYAFAVDNIYYSVGTAVPVIGENARVFKLYAGGASVEGCTAALNNSNIVSAALTADENGNVTLPEIEGGWYWYDPASGTIVTSLPAAACESGEIAVYAAAAAVSASFNGGLDGITVSNTAKTTRVGERLLLSAYLKSETAKDSNVQFSLPVFGSTRGAGVDSVRMTFKTSLTLVTQQAPDIAIRFRTAETWQNSLITVKSDNTIALPGSVLIPMISGERYDITQVITVSNTYNEDGTLGMGKISVASYVNGVYYGMGEVASRNAGVSVFTNASSCLNTLQCQLHSGSTYDTERTVAIDDVSFTYGAAPSESIIALSGASMRVDPETAERSGIRFAFGVDRAWFDAVKAAASEVKVGAIILPKDYTGELTALTHETLLGKKYLDVTTDTFNEDETTDEYYAFFASIVKLYTSNYARDFVAVGYVQVDGEYYYSDVTNARSIARVARNYAASGNVTEAHATRVKEYNDSVLFLTRSGDSLVAVTSAHYTSPYTVSYADGLLTVSGPISALKAIDIDGAVFTGGWRVSEDGASVSAPISFTSITYVANGGRISEAAPSYFISALGCKSLPAKVERSGYTFVGWYTSADFAEGTQVATIPAGTTEAVTLYARYMKTIFHYGFDDDSKPGFAPGNATVTANDGLGTWMATSGKNPSAQYSTPITQDSFTFSFDIGLIDGVACSAFVLRFRPAVGNLFDQSSVISLSNKKLYVNGVEVCDLSDGEMHRVTLVLTNDNASLALKEEALAARESGHTQEEVSRTENADGTTTVVTKHTYSVSTLTSKYQSTVTVKAYVDGVYVKSVSFKTFLTFGEGITLGDKGVAEVTQILNEDGSVKSTKEIHYNLNGTALRPNNGTDFMVSNTKMTRWQFNGGKVTGESGVYIDNFNNTDGAFSSGGTYFLNFNGGEATNDDYVENGVVRHLPTLTKDGYTFDGWYTSSDFAEGTQIGSIKEAPVASEIFAKFTPVE